MCSKQEFFSEMGTLDGVPWLSMGFGRPSSVRSRRRKRFHEVPVGFGM